MVARAVDQWLWSADSAQSVLGSLGIVVHEVGHGLDEHNPDNWYYVAAGSDGEDISFRVPGMHGKVTTSQSPMFSMERSLLLADDQNVKRPPRADAKIVTSKEFGEGDWGSDSSYAATYLTGDPSDGNFDSGDQGYNMLIEELAQYVNSLAIAYYFADHRYAGASSDRHAMLTLLWWNQRYLRKIRLEQPEQYAYLLANEAWLELVVTLWGRAWMYLRTELEGMQPDSDQLHHLVQEPVVLEEIARLRWALGCHDAEELLPEFVESR